MELSELAAYAREKYGIREQHKWPDFPGFSVLAEPSTGKWAALCMRQWDAETGEEIQRCDIRCGRACLAGERPPFLALPFRMKGQKWAGVFFGRQTRAETVFRLFDQAVADIAGQRAYTVILEDLRGNTAGLYRDAALPKNADRFAAAAEGLKTRSHASDAALPKNAGRFAAPSFGRSPGGALLDGFAATQIPQIPAKIRQMMGLYEHGGESHEARSRNFYRQGKFMEDYEDDAPWEGDYHRFFATYHDLRLSQLRGYFSWRTRVRRGQYGAIAASLAYMHVYELLCGIGASSPEDVIGKLEAFEKGFVDAGYGDAAMRKNLRQWMFDYAVVHGLPAETARRFEAEAVAERDRRLEILQKPGEHTDEEIFETLCLLGNQAFRRSRAILADEEKARHLFAGLWRYLSDHYTEDGGRRDRPAAQGPDGPARGDAEGSGREDGGEKGRDDGDASVIFTACFGSRVLHPWHPLANAVYWEEEPPRDAVYVLRACRIYRCEGGKWWVDRYENPYFAKDRFRGLLHAADRAFRRYCKTGHYLRARQEEAWAEPWIEAFIETDREADRRAREEATRLQVTIDMSGLDRIRRDASITRESLLTEEEKGEAAQAWTFEKPGLQPLLDTGGGPPSPSGEKQEGPADVDAAAFGLDPAHMRLLRALLAGRQAEGILREAHLMPSIAADTINEALFDEIGDNVLDCDGDMLSLVEDYREDVEALVCAP